MAKISFSKQFQVKKNERLPKLTLEYDEKARVALVGDLDAQFVHQLTKVKMDEDTGRALMEVKQRKDGTEYTVAANDFVGKFVCTGDYDTVASKGTDSKNCVFCAEAEQSGAFKPPARYTAVLTFRYKTSPGSFNVARGPFQGEVIPWIFADGKWNVLADIHEEYEEDGGVMNKDLLLGPCKGKDFQNYEIRAGSESYFRKDPQRVEQVQELVEAYEGDIATLFGRVATEVEAQKAIREINEAFEVGFSPSGVNNDRMASSSRAAVDSLFGAKEPVEDPDVEEETTDDDEEETKGDASNTRRLDELLDV